MLKFWNKIFFPAHWKCWAIYIICSVSSVFKLELWGLQLDASESPLGNFFNSRGPRRFLAYKESFFPNYFIINDPVLSSLGCYIHLCIVIISLR